MASQNLCIDYLYNEEVKLNGHLIDKKKIFISTYSVILFFALTVINKFRFGVSMSGVILPIALFVFLMVCERRTLIFTKSHMLVLLFWIFAAFSTVISDLVSVQRDIITFLIFSFFFIFCTAAVYSKEELKLMLKSYIFISVVCCLNIIWNYANDFAYGWNRYSLYILGVYRDPNYVSAFIIPAIGLVFNKILISKKMRFSNKIIYYSAFVLMILGALSTGSRSAFSVIGLVLLAIYLYHLTKIKSMTALLKTIVVLAIILISWTVIQNILPASLIMRLTGFKKYTGNVRLVLWSSGLAMFYRCPVFGSGLGSLTNYLFGEGLFYSHNLYLDILIGQGLVGILILGLMFKRFISVKKADRALLIILIFSFFMPFSFINGFNTASFWTPMILCEILSNYSRRNDGGILQVVDEI